MIINYLYLIQSIIIKTNIMKLLFNGNIDKLKTNVSLNPSLCHVIKKNRIEDGNI